MSNDKGVTLVPGAPWVTSVTLADGDKAITFRASGKDDAGEPHYVAKSKVKGFQDAARALGHTLVDKDSLADTAEGDEARIEQNEEK